jgi:aryl-alcohol dehydrogenase-like predicted oxidoreductase
MKGRVLGRTGLEVSELSLGGLFVSSVGGDFGRGRQATLRALELGVNYIDTAPTYADSEEVIGRFLEGAAAPLILSTKLGGRPKPFEPQNKDHLRKSLEESLRLLGRDQVDILMVHEPERPGHYEWWTRMEPYEGPVLEALAEFKAEGLVRFTGIGGTTVYHLADLARTGIFDVVLTAFNYSLLWREAGEGVIPVARAQNMGIVVGSPLQQGALARRYDDEVTRGARWLSPQRRQQLLDLYALLDEWGMNLAELGLRFVLSNPAVSCTLMGARSVEEVEQNIAAAEKGPLPAALLQRLDQLAGQVPFRPCEEPAVLPLGRQYRGPGPVR